MFKSYTDIFDQRGAAYHQAMQRFPDARAREFEAILSMSDLAAGQLVLDMPSGGGYLARYLPAPVRLVCVETSSEFVRSMLASPHHTVLLCDDISQLFLPDGCAERVLSLAGVHHLEDKPAFYREVFRLLKPQGLFCMADVRKDSAVDTFLNKFVHDHNSLGHEGAFLDQATGAALHAQGFEVLMREDRDYQWQFATAADMAQYCQQLFGIDRADTATILEGIQQHLGYDEHAGHCAMNWGLHFIKCRKP